MVDWGKLQGSERFRDQNNNYVNMRNVFNSNDNVFQLYPLIKKTKFIRNKKIFISSFKLKKPEISSKHWEKYEENR